MYNDEECGLTCSFTPFPLSVVQSSMPPNKWAFGVPGGLVCYIGLGYVPSVHDQVGLINQIIEEVPLTPSKMRHCTRMVWFSGGRADGAELLHKIKK